VKISAPISVGELIDKITILRIKLEKIAAPAQIANIRAEHDHLAQIYVENRIATLIDGRDEESLQSVNRELWEVEDLLREHEARGDFGTAFVELARSVYRLNDRRAAAKRSINRKTGSLIVEEKSYKGGG
jgi:hypothetical protein